VGRKTNAVGYYDFDVNALVMAITSRTSLRRWELKTSRHLMLSKSIVAVWPSSTGMAQRCEETHLDSASPGREPSYHFFTVLVERRDALARKLREAGVHVSIVHERNDAYTYLVGAATIYERKSF